MVARSTDADYAWLYGDVWIEPGVTLYLESSYVPIKDAFGSYVMGSDGTYTLIAMGKRDVTVRIILQPELYFSAKDMVKKGSQELMGLYRKALEESFRVSRIRDELGF